MPDARPARHRSMVGWYDPRVLMQSAYQIAIANIFGRHSDTRLIEALASQPQNEFDYSQRRATSGSTSSPMLVTAGIRPTRSPTPSRGPRSRSNTRAGAKPRMPAGCSCSVATRSIHTRRATNTKFAPRRRTAARSPAGRGPTYSRSREITTGTTAWSLSRAPSAGRTAGSRVAARARRAATSRSSCRPTGGCWPSTCSSAPTSTSRRCSISRRSPRAWTTPRA